jgi:hypothetical protein
MRTKNESSLDLGIHVIDHDKSAENANRLVFQLSNSSGRTSPLILRLTTIDKAIFSEQRFGRLINVSSRAGEDHTARSRTIQKSAIYHLPLWHHDCVPDKSSERLREESENRRKIAIRLQKQATKLSEESAALQKPIEQLHRDYSVQRRKP